MQMDKRSWLILYWCEGSKEHIDKRSSRYIADRVELTTSEPEMAAIYIKGLRGLFKPDETRLRCELSLHAVQQEKEPMIKRYGLIF